MAEFGVVTDQHLDTPRQGENEIGSGNHVQCSNVTIGPCDNLARVVPFAEPAIDHIGI